MNFPATKPYLARYLRVIEIRVSGGPQCAQGPSKKTYLHLIHHGETDLLFVNCNAWNPKTLILSNSARVTAAAVDVTSSKIEYVVESTMSEILMLNFDAFQFSFVDCI